MGGQKKHVTHHQQRKRIYRLHLGSFVLIQRTAPCLLKTKTLKALSLDADEALGYHNTAPSGLDGNTLELFLFDFCLLGYEHGYRRFMFFGFDTWIFVVGEDNVYGVIRTQR